MRLSALLLVAALVLAGNPASSEETYRQPPAPIAQILDAVPTPVVQLAPDKAWLLLLERPSLPAIADLAAPELRLAGLRLNPRTYGRSREPGYTGMVLR